MLKKKSMPQGETDSLRIYAVQVQEKNESVCVEEAKCNAAGAIDAAIEAVSVLARARSNGKLSSSRVVAVAKEMKELRKVLSVYC